MTRPLLNAFLALSLVFAAGLAAPAPALAAADARVDALIRPCFGVLTDPTLSTRCKPAKRKGGGGGPPPLRPPPTFIDCAYARPGQISDAIARNFDGVTITLTSSNGRACEESVVINRPARIVGDLRGPVRFDRPLLKAPPGAPCIRIAPSVWVSLENLTIAQYEGGSAPCILGQSDELTLGNVNLAYSGSGGGVVLPGDSRLTLADSRIVARSQEAAVAVRGRLRISNSTIGAAVVGLKAAPTEDAQIDGLELVRLDDWTGSRRSAASAGLVLADIAANDLIEIRGLEVTGFSRGAYVAGAGEVAFTAPVVRSADWALLVEGPSTRIARAQLSAAEVGVYAAAGTTYVAGANIQGVMRSGIFAERGAQVRGVDNVVYASKDGCAALKTGFFDGALTCRNWYEAPELGGVKGQPSLPTFDSFRAVLDDEQNVRATQLQGGPDPQGGPGIAAPLPGAPVRPSNSGPSSSSGVSPGGVSK